MDATTLSAVSAAISAIAAVASVIATFIIIRLTSTTIKAYQKQISIGQDQVAATQYQTYNQSRPILLPPEAINVLQTNQGRKEIKWQLQGTEVERLRNIGTGPAFNIYGLLFPMPYQQVPPTVIRYAIWNHPVLVPGVPGQPFPLEQGTVVKSTTTIGGHTLYLPDDPEHAVCIFRLTLTYHDIAGRKLASIYDYHRTLGWMCVDHVEGLEHDLYELEQQEWAIQQSNQLVYAQSHQPHP